ncbi:SELENBP1-like protein [Aphelenchoides besseyi]|nr:SELENBP1-like protein [Aphelenchoides besseyi]
MQAVRSFFRFLCQPCKKDENDVQKQSSNQIGPEAKVDTNEVPAMKTEVNEEKKTIGSDQSIIECGGSNTSTERVDCCESTGILYATPAEACKGPREKILIVTCPNVAEASQPDAIVTVDVDPESSTFCETIEAKDLSVFNASFPHTSHCLADGTIMVSTLGDNNGDNRGLYGNKLHVFNWSEKKHIQTITLEGETGWVPLEVRFLHEPSKAHAFVGTALGSAIIHIYQSEVDGEYKQRVAAAVPSKWVKGWVLNDMPALITEIIISMDDRYMYLSCWLQGIVQQYDISDPFNFKLTGQVEYDQTEVKGRRIDGGPQMMQLSLDGKRLYVTTSLYSVWDEQFYPDLPKNGGVMLQIDVDTENGGMTLNPDFLIDFGQMSGGPFCGHEMRFPTDEISRRTYGKRFDCSLYNFIKSRQLLEHHATYTSAAVDEMDNKWMPVFATAVSNNHFNESRLMMKKLRELYPDSTVLYFDLGLTFYQEVLREHKAFFFFDSSARLLEPRLNELVAQVQSGKMPPMFGFRRANHSIYATTNPEMYKYLPITTSLLRRYNEPGATMMFISDSEYTRRVLKWYALCLLTEDCVQKRIANQLCQVKQFASHDVYNKYMNCHRYDQAAMVLAKLGVELPARNALWAYEYSQFASYTPPYDSKGIIAAPDLWKIVEIRRNDRMRNPLVLNCTLNKLES